MTTRADALANTADGTDSIGDRRAEIAWSKPWHVGEFGAIRDERGEPVANSLDLRADYLIAAAPALYEALDRLLHETMFKDHPEASQMAIDALALARGEKK